MTSINSDHTTPLKNLIGAFKKFHIMTKFLGKTKRSKFVNNIQFFPNQSFSVRIIKNAARFWYAVFIIDTLIIQIHTRLVQYSRDTNTQLVWYFNGQK